MAFIRSFRIEGLVGRKSDCSFSLNEGVNVFFGPNGSGKTSLLRILHSALSGDADMLKDVPFSKAEVVIFSYAQKSDFTYTLDTTSKNPSPPPSIVRAAAAGLRRPVRKKTPWQVAPPLDNHAWFHKYLPISRLYASPNLPPTFLYSEQSPTSEEALEAQFAQNLAQIWKDYSADVAREVNKAQEAGLARILEAVISRSESSPDPESGDPAKAYRAVSNFLSRRGMHNISLSDREFLRRYKVEPQLRSVATDIEAVERRIAAVTQPREDFKRLANELFFGGKLLGFTEKGDIEVAVENKKISLSMLSSGEKQLLRILVDTLATGPFMILIDEPELSMHVDWQRRLIPSMSILNPSAQMIFTTHSPEIMADLPDNEIFRLWRD
jgi:energy-coupling factor transporter ATP-binding protein EcfA2